MLEVSAAKTRLLKQNSEQEAAMQKLRDLY
uniref:Uncharacterized protein n=1 Tax=Arundo donax TaxID=35708 RepID=A0A0A8YW41_ARUDO